jgi:hypothetical protein
MEIKEPFNTWIKQHVGESVDANTRFVLQISAATSQGVIPVSAEFDMVWFIILNIKDDDKVRLDVCLELLNQKEFLEPFKATMNNQNIKRLLAEFLMFNMIFLQGLKKFIDFNILDVPVDFISHTLFMRRSHEPDTVEMANMRIDIIKTVLDSGFVLSPEQQVKSAALTIDKLLQLPVNDKFEMLKRLTSVGFKVFSNNDLVDSEVARALLDNRNNNICLDLINANVQNIAKIRIKIPGAKSLGNIADYYYWVKEDMQTVDFIRKKINIDIAS